MTAKAAAVLCVLLSPDRVLHVLCQVALCRHVSKAMHSLRRWIRISFWEVQLGWAGDCLAKRHGQEKDFRCLKVFINKNAGDELRGGGGLQSWTWTSISHTSLSDLLLWLWAQRWLSREGPRFVTANRCLNIFSYLAENGRRNGQKGWQRFCRWWLLLHLPQIFCVFPPAGSQAWDQPKDLSVPSTV